MKVTEHVEHLLRQGRKPKELIDLGFPKSVVSRVRRRLREEKAAKEAKMPRETNLAKRHRETVAEPRDSMAAIEQKMDSVEKDLQRLGSLMNALPEVTILATAARKLGSYRHETCPYQKDGVCTLWTWSSEDDIPPGVGEPVAADERQSEWYIKPSALYCALCPIPFEERLDDVEDKLVGNPLWGARDITCDGCGSKGLVAIKIMCTKCRRETYFGWWPEK